MSVAGATPAPTGTPSPSATPQWFEGFDDDTKGYVQNRGLDKKTPAEAFLETARAHREAEKLIGAPASELLRLPKDPNSPEWKTVHERLGKPKEPTEYDFSSVKRAGDKPLDGALADTLRKAAFDGNMTKEAAVRLASDVVKHLDGEASAKAADDAANLLREKTALKQNWGANEAANMVVARAAAASLGIDPATIEKLESVAGYAKVMEMFRDLGTRIGEARFITNQNGPAGNVMTKEMAQAEITALKSDAAWVKRFIDGGLEERRKMDALNRIIAGVSA